MKGVTSFVVLSVCLVCASTFTVHRPPTYSASVASQTRLAANADNNFDAGKLLASAALGLSIFFAPHAALADGK